MARLLVRTLCTHGAWECHTHLPWKNSAASCCHIAWWVEPEAALALQVAVSAPALSSFAHKVAHGSLIAFSLSFFFF